MVLSLMEVRTATPANPSDRTHEEEPSRVRRRHRLRGWLRAVAIAVSALVVAGGLLVAATWVTTPSVDGALARAQRVAREHGGTPLAPGHVPATLATALIDTEDAGFLSEPGISPRGIARALLVDVPNHCLCQGGSTIDQQLVENLYLPTRGKSIPQYWRGAVMALKLDRRFTKEEILAAYFSEVYLGHEAYGAVMAARVYFHRPLQDLTLTQYAMLAGLPQAPSLYDPIAHPLLARDRLRVVLSAMVANGHLTSRQAAVAAQGAL
ncbi:MAG: transglycosylase domain-containing protein [Candidatus Dormibacteraeota bacterium]|nr:transglycosylase domain-containing protein [Candidatus Dormibacteraeota bacterium]